MSTLAQLKAKSAEMLANIKESASSQGNSNKDDRIWTPTYDKEKGSGYAVVRFLAPPDGETFPYVTLYSHGFKGPSGKWYIENSLSTLKQKDPVGEMNSALWNSGVESDKDVMRKHKRRENIFANVLIINDPMNPELNGTVKIYRYGPMIKKILEEKMFPKFETDVALNPFDMWTGADFEIRIVEKQVGKDKVPNYEKSFFKEPSPLGDDERIEEVWSQTHKLQELISPDKFKSYDELKNNLYSVLGPTVGSGIPTVPGFEDIPKPSKAKPKQNLDEDESFTPRKNSAMSEEPPFDIDDKDTKSVSSSFPSDDDDDISYFNSL
jgi:hypothetical protein